MKPHRGTLILMTGLLGVALVIVSLVLSVLVVKVFNNPIKPAGSGSVFLHALEVSVVGLVFGYIAFCMARMDLHKMHVGRMDRKGRPRTNAGRRCGIVAMSVAAANIAVTLILWLMIDTAGADGVASWMR
jgi:hypothetical protein